MTLNILGFLAGLGLLTSGAASAATLAASSLSISFAYLNPAVFPGVGASGTATSQLSAGIEAGGAFIGSATDPYNIYTLWPPITQFQLKVTGNEAGSFTGTAPGAVGGSVAFSSLVLLKGAGGLTLLKVPLKVGVPSTTTVAAFGVLLTLTGSSWTAGTAAVTGLTSGTVTSVGSNGLDGSGVGTLKLVSGVKIVSNLGPILPGFAVLTLTYVPEPGTLGLLGAGMLALALAGRRRL